MIDTAIGRSIVGRLFGASARIIKAFVNATDAPDAQSLIADDPGGSHIINARRHPSSIREFVERLGGFVIASDKDGEIRSSQFATIIFVKGSHGSVFGRHGEAVKIRQVA